MRIYFDIIFVVLNVILFALNFHFALESKSSKSYTYAILGMTFAIGAGTILATYSKENGALLPLLILVIEFCNPNKNYKRFICCV